MKIALTIVALTVLGFFLRLTNVSPYKFYPDAYQNLIVARSIRTYQSVVGYLGNNGMVYPDFFMWTRPVYPLLINIANNFIHHEERAAHLIAVFMGILAIPLSFALTKLIFGKDRIALCAVLLITLSFNHAVWGGFIMTESVGVLAQMLFLIVFFAGIRHKTTLGNLFDFGTGALFTIAVFTRYEYAIIAVPIVLYTLLKADNPLLRLLNFGISAAVGTALFITQLYPINSLFSVIYRQHAPFFLPTIAIITTSVLITVAYRKIPMHTRASITYYLGIVVMVLIWFFAVMFVLFSAPEGISNFFKDDLFLGVFVLTGLTALLLDEKYRSLALFISFTCVSLYAFYYRVNPAMQRYGTHLLPIFLIPASWGLSKLFAMGRKHLILWPFIAVVILLQLKTTATGIKYWHDGVWMRPSYEERSAQKVGDTVTDRDTILIVSEPEPYFFFTNLSTQSLAVSYPYLYIDSKLDDKKVVIVFDVPMRDLFPEFSGFVEKHLTPYKKDVFRVGETYRYKTYGLPEDKPVILYSLPLSTLRETIEAGNFKGEQL